MPCPGDAGAPFEKMPIVMAALHATGEVGLVGWSAELPQPDSIAANATHAARRTIIFDKAIAAGDQFRVERDR